MPNLLVNGDFQINQRGKAEYNESKDGSYTVDMWKTRQGNYSNAIKIVPKKGGGITVTLPSAGINAGINQFLPYEDIDLGKKFTAVVSIDKVPYPFTFELSTSPNKTNIKEGVELSCSYNDDLKCIEYRLYFANNSEHNIQNIPFDVDYCDLFPGEIAYKHQEEDNVTALMRCKDFYRKEWFMGVLTHDYNDPKGAYLFEIALPGMAKKDIVVNVLTAYYYNTDDGSQNTKVDVLAKEFRKYGGGTNEILWVKLGNKVKTPTAKGANILLELSVEPL